MRALAGGWVFWSLLAAVFAAATAILAKVGLRDTPGDPGAHPGGRGVCRPDRHRHGPVAGGWRAGAPNLAVPDPVGPCHGRLLALLLPGAETGGAARVAPLDKLSVVLVAVLGTAFLGEQLSLKNWLGVAMIAGGAVLVALQ